MRNKVHILGAFLLPLLMLTGAGCSKEDSASSGGKNEPVSKAVGNHAAEARKLIESKKEKAKSDCGTYLTARAGSGRVRYTDEKGPDKKGEITVVGTLNVPASGGLLSFKCTVKASDGPIYGIVNLELYKIESSATEVSK